MSRLLVSVRNLAEAQLAVDAGVDLLDLKEPTRGALGAVDPSVVAEVVDYVADRVPVSMALGELLDLPTDAAPSLAISRRLAYVKVGLARCAAQPDWLPKFVALSNSLPNETSLVAVVYADAASVGAPGVDEVLEAAAAARCSAVLVDTAIKDGRSLLDHWSPAVVRRFIAELSNRRLMSVVGGSLNGATIAQVASLGPDYVAVRGAVCRGERTGAVDAEKLREVRAALNASGSGRLEKPARAIV